MSVELLHLLKNGINTNDRSKKQWIMRKEALRVQRELHYGLKKERTRRQVANRQVEAVTESGLEISSRKSSPPSRISAGESEWSGVTGGPPAEVVLRLHPSTPAYPNHTKGYNISTAEIERSKVTDCPPAEVVLRRHTSKSSPEITIANMSLSNMGSSSSNGSGVVVRAEEALIVAFVLLLWVAAIALFFNRWGKIRMLEPYQPKFQQQHRQSCVLAENSVSVPPHHRASLSRGCVSYDYGGSFPSYQPCGYLAHRQRQNSVFVGSMGGMALIPESPPRRSRSAADLPALITPSDHMTRTPRSSRAASLHSAVDLRVCVPSPRTSRAASLHSAVDMPQGSVQVHVRGSVTNLNRPRSPRRLTITNV